MVANGGKATPTASFPLGVSPVSGPGRQQLAVQLDQRQRRWRGDAAIADDRLIAE